MFDEKTWRNIKKQLVIEMILTLSHYFQAVMEPDIGIKVEDNPWHVESQNPWHVESLYDFSYFCCPECDTKCQDKQEFVDHAFYLHPEVRYLK